LAVLDSAGKVLRNDDTTALDGEDEVFVANIKTFLAKWSPSK